MMAPARDKMRSERFSPRMSAKPSAAALENLECASESDVSPRFLTSDSFKFAAPRSVVPLDASERVASVWLRGSALATAVIVRHLWHSEVLPREATTTWWYEDDAVALDVRRVERAREELVVGAVHGVAALEGDDVDVAREARALRALH